MDDPLALGGGRFSLRRVDGPPPAVVKSGPAAELAHEADALRLLQGMEGVPALRAHDPGRLEMGLVPGSPRDLAVVPHDDLRRLGALLGRLAAFTAPAATPPGGGAPIADPAAYAARRAASACAALAAAGHPVPIAAPPAMRPPFRLVHGDLVAANIVWAPEPHLVDWEFWRFGDPAEDLAYLAVANGLDATAMAAVLAGHGDTAAAARVAGWRPVAAAEIAAWWIAAGREDLAGPALAEPGLSPPSGPSAPPRPADGGAPA